MKLCNKCLTEKDESEFPKNGTQGLYSCCKKCKKDYDKVHNSSPDRKKKLQNYSLKKLYGISVKEKNELKEAQGNRCIICNKWFSKPEDAHVDHDHSTGRIRGILCRRCNRVLGFVEESKVILEKMINYLR